MCIAEHLGLEDVTTDINPFDAADAAVVDDAGSVAELATLDTPLNAETVEFDVSFPVMIQLFFLIPDWKTV